LAYVRGTKQGEDRQAHDNSVERRFHRLTDTACIL
jgi:hypothetical protein